MAVDTKDGKNRGCLNIFVLNSLNVTLLTTSTVFGGCFPVTKESETSSFKNKFSKKQVYLFVISIYTTNKKCLLYLNNLLLFEIKQSPRATRMPL